MDIIKNYKFLATLEVEEKLSLVPELPQNRDGILVLLGLVTDVVMELDKSLSQLFSAFTSQNEMSSIQLEAIIAINSDSLAMLLSRAFIVQK